MFYSHTCTPCAWVCTQQHTCAHNTMDNNTECMHITIHIQHTDVPNIAHHIPFHHYCLHSCSHNCRCSAWKHISHYCIEKRKSYKHLGLANWERMWWPETIGTCCLLTTSKLISPISTLVQSVAPACHVDTTTIVALESSGGGTQCYHLEGDMTHLVTMTQHDTFSDHDTTWHI